MYLLELLSPVGLNRSVPMAAPLCTTEPRRSASSDMYPSWEARTIAVCPLTTAGAPSEDAKEPTMAQIPKPAAPTPVNSFNPLAIMACAPANCDGGSIINRRRLPDARQRDTRMLFTSSRFVCANEVIFGIVDFNTRFCFKI